VSVRTSHPLSALARLLFLSAALFVLQAGAHAQGIGAHRGDTGGGTAGGGTPTSGGPGSPTAM